MVTEREQKKDERDCSSVTQRHLNWHILGDEKRSQDVPEIHIWGERDEGTR